MVRIGYGFIQICLAYTIGLSIFLVTPALANERTVVFDIPPQALDSALDTLARQADIQLLYNGQALDEVRSPGVRGRYTVREALDLSLTGTGFDYVFTAENSVVVRLVAQSPPSGEAGSRTNEPAGAGAANSPDSVDLPVLTVSDMDRSYTSATSFAATKTDVPIFDTPMSIQVVPRTVLDDQQVVSLREGLKNVSGVQHNLEYGSLYDGFVIRGFRSGTSIYRNGLRLHSFDFEIANLEQIEVVKGPSAALYGRIQPGGLVNIVTKPPAFQPSYGVQAQVGSYDFYRLTAEATGPLGESESLAYRVDAAYQNSDSFRDFIFLDRIFVAPSLTWAPSDRTEFNFTLEYQDSELNADNGVVAVGSRPGAVPISFSSDDGDDFYKQARTLFGFDWSHRFNDTWALTNRVVVTQTDYDQTDILPFFLDEDDRTLERALYKVDMTRDFQTANLDLIGRFQTGAARHTVLVGADYYNYEQDTLGWYLFFDPNIPPLDIFEPVYGIADINAAITETDRNLYFRNDERWYGVYIQDQIQFGDNVHLLIGGRYDKAEIGTGFSETSLSDASVTMNEDTHFSPRLGLVYQPRHWVSLYGSYSESLGSNNGRSATGTPLDPQIGSQYEVGVKTEFFDQRLVATAALFSLTNENLLTANPEVPGTQTTIGEARSQGLEVDVSGRVTPELSIIATYAYTDAELTRNNDGNQGNRLPNVAEHTGSLWGKYDFLNGSLRGFSLGAGVFFASEKEGNNANTLQLPSYTRVDAAAAYAWHLANRTRLTARLNVFNLFDEEYYESTNTIDGVPEVNIIPGAPRAVMGSISFQY